ncbi:hypothetical protein TNCV_3373741 [Trichonephila clavipes]|nr:hypothetical protein TNCV_3373741 [Trichonephila clavipes]
MGNSGHCRANPEATGEIQSRCHLSPNYRIWLYGSIPLLGLGVSAYEACPLCGRAKMDGDHLFQCTGLDDSPADDIVKRYWEARRHMVKTPSIGVGKINQ